MKKNKRKLHFTMSFAKLITLCNEKEALFNRDQAVLAARGITAARIAAFATQINTLVNIPQNKTVIANVTISKKARDADVKQLKQLMKEVWGIAATTFGENTAEYKCFGSTSISRLNAQQTTKLAMKIVATAEINFAAMQPKGLTHQMLIDIEDLTNSVAAKSSATNVSKAAKTGFTDNRIAVANKLFDELRNMCNTAFVYFENRDKLKASHYIIYKVKGKQQQRNGIVAAGQMIHKKLQSITANSKFKLQVSDGNSLSFYFGKSIDGSNYTKKLTVPVNTQEFLPCTAADLGYSSKKGYLYFCIDNTAENAVNAVYKVRVK